MYISCEISESVELNSWLISALLLLYVSKAFEELVGIFPVFLYCSPQCTIPENDQQEIQQVKTECVLRCCWESVRCFVDKPHSDTQCLNFWIFSLIPWKYKHIIANKKKYVVFLNEGEKKNQRNFTFHLSWIPKCSVSIIASTIKYFSSRKLKD